MTVCAVAATCAGVLPSAAAAAPPLNDNYLSSLPINRRGTVLTRQTVKDLRDTREATVQADLFTPPAAGGGAENINCKGSFYGKTVWYDFHPDSYGTAELQSAGYDGVIAVYEFDPNTSRPVRVVACQNDAGVTDDLFVAVERGHSYTVQIGGVAAGSGPASGDLQFTFQFFGDRDRDGVLDPLDHCPGQAGSRNESGCPPELRSTPKLVAMPTGSGIHVRSLTVSAPRGSRVALRCRRKCRLREAHAAQTVSLRSVRGRSFAAGTVFEVSVTKPRSIGNLYRYVVTRGDFRRSDRCLPPGSRRPRVRCR